MIEEELELIEALDPLGKQDDDVDNDGDVDSSDEYLANRRKAISKAVKNEGDDYDEFFKQAMEKFGIDDLGSISDEKKKELFNYVDANWAGKKEKD